MEAALVNQEFLLEKMEGKGGWTYVLIPEVMPDRKTPFGWVRVRGTIDDFEIRAYNLMPYGNGKLFMGVKAEIRKKIKKQAGDKVRLVLYADNLPTEIPDELVECLQMETGLYEKFMSFTDGDRKGYIDWIYSAKTDETRANRIVKMLEKVGKGLKFYQ